MIRLKRAALKENPAKNKDYLKIIKLTNSIISKKQIINPVRLIVSFQIVIRLIVSFHIVREVKA